MSRNTSGRRSFIKKAALVGSAFTIVPRFVLGGKGYIPPSDKLNIAAIGVGGRGMNNLNELTSENHIAFADVDWNLASSAFNKWPKAHRYKDYRIMLEKHHAEIDAVVISTPDHAHAGAGLATMSLGKHVFIEKPLAHNIAEVRALTEMASINSHLITQMGNQGASGEGIRISEELFKSGIIGEVNKVYAWTNRPVWPQGGPAPKEVHAVPDHLDWNLWLGPAKFRPYNKIFHPFSWRGFWDYGTGALGDMGCHILDTPFYILNLGFPAAAEASVSQIYSQNWTADYNPESCPPSSKVHVYFPSRDEMPPVELVWMDGGILPGRPEELLTEELMGNRDGGVLMIGSKGKLLADVYGRNPRLLPTSLMNEISIPKTIPRVMTSHGMDWVNGIKQGYQPSSHFGKAGSLTETVLMGNLAIRAFNYRTPKAGGRIGEVEHPGRTKLLWDGKNMQITNVDDLNQFVKRENPRNF